MKPRRMSGKKRSGRLLSAAATAAASTLLVWSQVAPVVDAQNMTTPPTGPANDTPEPQICGGLDCQHNSTCQAGNVTYSLDTPVGFHTVTNQNGFHCACPSGFAGLDCSRPVQDCGLSGINAMCFHGGNCLPQSEMKDVAYAAFCDCSGALYQDQRYAGKYCEVPVVEEDYCPEQSGLFCFNDGTCPEGGARAEDRCNCPDGYFGTHCEYTTPQGPDCTLKCFNEGVCRVGRVNAPWGNKDDFYCECPRGYGGIQCEHLSETCGDGDSVCLHGATCESTIMADGSSQFSCKCPDPYLGGSSCQAKRRMALCNPTLGPEYSLGMAVPAFCLNGGTCRDAQNGQLVDFACDCPPLFEGPHCEFLRTAEAIGDIDDLLNPLRSDHSGGVIALSVLLSTLVFVAGFFVSRQVLRTRRSRKREQDVILNLQDYREENFGAVSANGSMLFPGVSPPPSTVLEPAKSSSTNSFAAGELLHEVDIT